MATTFSPAPRRYPSPAAQARTGEQWRVRAGLTATMLLTIGTAAALWQVLAQA